MAGTSPELYSCVAPLVMNPEIIKYNHNYPFKTGESFVWFVAFADDGNHVLGFFPVEIRKKSAIINNYYVEEDTKDVFLSLLEAVTNEFLSTEKELEAVGDIFITGIVGSSRSGDPLMLQSIRLSIVMRLADCISRSICLGMNVLERRVENFWREPAPF